ncbi:hypothetical protein TRIUR3_13167 [Triticum urartu]|uniref:Uncharacterized protein n=1 Tax=Triticum urartu TaxID=4572 RepID=M8AMU6_TRIUA|nr:hypothetical protein TRIUR3_13167 [Triticum urartu]
MAAVPCRTKRPLVGFSQISSTRGEGTEGARERTMRAVEQGIERGGAGDLARQGRGQLLMRQKSTNARCVFARAALDAFEEQLDAVEEDSQGGPAGGGTAGLGG